MESRCYKPLHIHKKNSLIKSLFFSKSRTETVTLRVFVCSGDFSGTLNISQTRQHLFNYLFLTETHFTEKNSSTQIYPLIWKPLKKYLFPLSEFRHRQNLPSTEDLSFCVNSPSSCQSAQGQFVIGSCSSSSPSPCFPTGSVGLWTLSVTLTPGRPSSLPPCTLRTLKSHNIPWVPSANRKWHSSHRLWRDGN